MFYKTERQKRQILGCFIRQKDRKDRYWDTYETRQERQIEPFAMLTYFRHRDSHFEYIVKV